MRALEPYVLLAAIRADRDEEEQVYHLREEVALELPEDSVAELEQMAASMGCDFEVLVNAVLAEYCDRAS